MTGLIVDNFAGGGGASTGIEAALGRPVDVAINHDPEAIAMHAANHPATKHYIEDIWTVDPREVADGRPVDLAWFSPDCTHFSKAKGGRPRDKKIRGLAWVAVKWAFYVRPRVIILENVEEFREWGPLGPSGQPIRAFAGRTFEIFLSALRRHGYAVEYRELRACDYGAPTTRKRFFLIARCDGEPIVWPAKTHGPGRLPYRTAAECMDWTIPCPSIFGRKKPLADATCRRIAKGIVRFVLNNPKPFLIQYHKDAAFRGQSVDEPIMTVDSSPRYALVTAFLAKHYGGVVGTEMGRPVDTITAVDHHGLVTSNLIKMRGTNVGQPVDAPLQTISAQGTHFAEVRAFLTKYYGHGIGEDLHRPMGTVVSRDRFGLVTVVVDGSSYALADIGMRMLQPRELFRAQGFPDSYVIDPTVNGKPLTKTAQVRMVGNSVCPPLAEALVRANLGGAQAGERTA